MINTWVRSVETSGRAAYESWLRGSCNSREHTFTLDKSGDVGHSESELKFLLLWLDCRVYVR